MTIISQISEFSYTANGVATGFVFFNTVYDQDTIAVYLNGALQTRGTDYTVEIASGNSSATIRFISAPAASDSVLLVRNQPIEQEIGLPTAGIFPAASVERGLDESVMRDQQMLQDLNRALRTPITDTVVSGDIPAVATRANKVLSFDASGNPEVSASTRAQIDAAVTTIETLAGAAAGSSAGISHIAADTGAVATTVQAKLREWVSPEDFGAVGDGVTDDIDAIILAHNTGKNVRYTSGKTYRVYPSVGDLSKVIPIKEYQTVDWNGCKIWCSNGAKAVYYIDARTGFVPRHLSNIICYDVLIYTDRAGRTYGTSVDFEHFLYIHGGFIMGCRFTNFAGSLNLAARSIVYLDLNYTAGSPPEAGVADGVVMQGMYFLGSYGVSSILLIDGGASAANESRIGNWEIGGFFLGCIDTKDFDDRSANTGKNGAVILNASSVHYSEFGAVFGGVAAILLLDGAEIRTSRVFGAYNELVNQQSTGKRGAIIADATSSLYKCTIQHPQLFVIGANFSVVSYNYSLIDAVCYECDIVNPYFYENGENPAVIPATLINLKSGSYGNRVDHLSYLGKADEDSDGSDFSQKFITGPLVSNQYRSFCQPFTLKTSGVVLASGVKSVFTVPARAIELNDSFRFKVFVTGASGTARALTSVSVFLASSSYTVSATPLMIEGYMSMNSASSKATVSTAAIDAVWDVNTGSGAAATKSTAGLYTRGDDLIFYVDSTAGCTVEYAELELIRKGYVNAV